MWVYACVLIWKGSFIALHPLSGHKLEPQVAPCEYSSAFIPQTHFLCKQVPLLALITHLCRNKHSETLFTDHSRCIVDHICWAPLYTSLVKRCQHTSTLLLQESCCVKIFQTSCQITADVSNDPMNSYRLGHNGKTTISKAEWRDPHWTHCYHCDDMLQWHHWARTSASVPIVVRRMWLISQVDPMCFARLDLRPDTNAVVIIMLLGKAFTKLKVFSLIKMDEETVLLCC